MIYILSSAYAYLRGTGARSDLADGVTASVLVADSAVWIIGVCNSAFQSNGVALGSIAIWMLVCLFRRGWALTRGDIWTL